MLLTSCWVCKDGCKIIVEQRKAQAALQVCRYAALLPRLMGNKCDYGLPDVDRSLPMASKGLPAGQLGCGLVPSLECSSTIFQASMPSITSVTRITTFKGIYTQYTLGS